MDESRLCAVCAIAHTVPEGTPFQCAEGALIVALASAKESGLLRVCGGCFARIEETLAS